MDPRSLRALSFDCYGTLVDWRGGLRAFVAGVLGRRVTSDVRRPSPDEWVARWERVLGQMSRPWRPYRELVLRSYDATMQHFGLEAFVDDGPTLLRAIAEWPPLPGVTRALRRLARRYQLAIVTNVDRDLLSATVGQLQAPFSSLVSADDARAYKPDPRAFELLLERLALPPPSVLHVAVSVPLDLAPARALGMRTALINDAGEADLRAPSVDALATLLGL